MQISKLGFIYIIVFMSEQPIPEDPPVIMTTEKRLKYSKCLVDVFEFGIFLALLYKSGDTNHNH